MDQLFERSSIKKAYFTLAMPVVLSSAIIIIYNLVDTFFVSKTQNPDLVAGVSQGAPVFSLLIAIGDIFGLGGSSLISRLFGEKRDHEARLASGYCFYVSIIVGILMTIIMVAFQTPILHLLGATTATWQYAREYKKSGRPVPHTIHFLGTCDEEMGGIGAREILKEVPETSIGTLLIGEPTGCRLGVAQKGCLWLEIEAHGKTSHGAYPQEGCNAVEQAMALTGEIETYVKSFTHPVLGASTAQVTQISGGVAPNMTPDTCRILMDIRMTPGLTSQMVVGQAEAFAAARSVTSEEKFRISCRIVNDRRAIEIGESHPLVKQLSKGLEKKGLPVETTGINFFTDASILVEHKLDAAVLLFGPGEAGMAHKPNERVEIEKYQKSIQVLMDLIASEVDE